MHDRSLFQVFVPVYLQLKGQVIAISSPALPAGEAIAYIIAVNLVQADELILSMAW
jgi:hypothetical protein